MTTALTVNYQLEEGFNLVSIYNLPEDAGVSSILCSMGNNANSIIGQGVAATNLGDCNWIGSLHTLEATSGYWIDVTDSDDLMVTGMRISPDIEYSFNTINNLISYVGQDGLDISSAIPDDVEDRFIGVIGQGAASIQVAPGQWVGSLDKLTLGEGYWIMLDNDSPLEFSWEYSDLGKTLNSDNDPISIPVEYSYVQSTEQSFYFIETIEIEGIIPDMYDWIIAYHGNTVVGARNWNDSYIDIPVMGYDSRVITEEYMINGQRPEFKFFDSSSGELIELTFEEDIDAWENNGLFILGKAMLSSDDIVTEYELSKAYPNPFNPTTQFNVHLSVDSEISLLVYDIMGREIDRIYSGLLSSGNYSFVWDAREFSNGIYFLQLNNGEKISTQKLLLMK